MKPSSFWELLNLLSVTLRSGNFLQDLFITCEDTHEISSQYLPILAKTLHQDTRGMRNLVSQIFVSPGKAISGVDVTLVNASGVYADVCVISKSDLEAVVAFLNRPWSHKPLPPQTAEPQQSIHY